MNPGVLGESFFSIGSLAYIENSEMQRNFLIYLVEESTPKHASDLSKARGQRESLLMGRTFTDNLV